MQWTNFQNCSWIWTGLVLPWPANYSVLACTKDAEEAASASPWELPEPLSRAPFQNRPPNEEWFLEWNNTEVRKLGRVGKERVRSKWRGKAPEVWESKALGLLSTTWKTTEEGALESGKLKGKTKPKNKTRYIL